MSKNRTLEKQKNGFEAIEYGPNITGSPAKESGGTGVENIIFTFHGYSRNGWFMDKIAREFLAKYPKSKIYSLHAPHLCENPDKVDVAKAYFPDDIRDHDGNLRRDRQYQWFSILGGRLRIWLRVWFLLPKINRYMDVILREHNLGAENCALIGFSQGGVVAMCAALRRRRAPACVVGHSTLFWGYMPTRCRVPVYFLYGDQDHDIHPKTYAYSIRQLTPHAAPLKTEIISGLGHYMSASSRRKVIEYVGSMLRRI